MYWSGHLCLYISVPETVRNIRFTTTPTSITLTWDPPVQQTGMVQGYTVEYYILSHVLRSGGSRTGQNGDENGTANSSVVLSGQSVVRRSVDSERSIIRTVQRLGYDVVSDFYSNDFTKGDKSKGGNPKDFTKEQNKGYFNSREREIRRMEDTIPKIIPAHSTEIIKKDEELFNMKMVDIENEINKIEEKSRHQLVKRNTDPLTTESDVPDWVSSADQDKLQTTCRTLVYTSPLALQLLDEILLNRSKAAHGDTDNQTAALLSDVLEAWSAQLDSVLAVLVYNTSTGLTALSKGTRVWLLQGNISVWDLCYKLHESNQG